MSRQRFSRSTARNVCAALLVCLASAVTGCTPAMQKFSPSNMWHNVQPYRLQKLNRGEGMSTDAYFSVADPIPERFTDRVDEKGN